MQIRSKAAILSAAVIASLSVAAQAGNLHVFTSDISGFNTHSIWYDDGQEVTVVDTQFTPQIAEKLISDIQAQTKSPITRVIVTHPNPDKFNALSVFHKLGADSIASKKTAELMPVSDAYKRYFWVKIAKAFTDENYPMFETEKTTFQGKTTITLKSGETISLIELSHPGVSAAQTVVRFDATGDMAVGDLVHYKNHAWLEGGIVDGHAKPDLAGWKADLLELKSLGTGTVYGGRGEFGKVADVVPAQIAYLDKADAIVDAYIKGLGDKKDQLSDPQMSGTHYAAIQAEFVKAFPDYAYADLISYSIYGLVNQKLAAQ